MSNIDFGPALAALAAADESDEIPSTITLPMAGADGKTRDYVITEGTGTEMLRLWAVQSVYRRTRAGLLPVEGDAEIVDALSQRDLMAMSLGDDVTAQALADGVPMSTLRRAIAAATAFRLGSMDNAKAEWSGKAHGPKTRSGRTGAAAAATKPASTSGTSTRRKSKRQ